MAAEAPRSSTRKLTNFTSVEGHRKKERGKNNAQKGGHLPVPLSRCGCWNKKKPFLPYKTRIRVDAYKAKKSTAICLLANTHLASTLSYSTTIQLAHSKSDVGSSNPRWGVRRLFFLSFISRALARAPARASAHALARAPARALARASELERELERELKREISKNSRCVFFAMLLNHS